MISDNLMLSSEAVTHSSSSLSSFSQGQSETWRAEDLIRVCRRTVEGWRGLPKVSFMVTPISGGMTNYLYRCATTCGSASPESALVRIFGSETSICRAKDNIIFQSLAEASLGPKLYGTFEGGRVEEFLEDNRPLLNEEMKLPQFAQQTARRLGMVHELNIPVEKDIPQLLLDTKRLASQLLADDKLLSLLPNSPEYYLSNLARIITTSSSPVVFCHNDLQEGNILVSNRDEELTLIDFEYGGYNYAYFDIGNHLAEYAFLYTDSVAGDLAFHLHRDQYPSRRQTLRFLSEYSSTIQGPEPEDMIADVQKFMCASHIYWGLWAAVMSRRGEGYATYMRTRFNEFEHMAENLL